MINKKWTPHIITAVSLVVLIVLGLACASEPTAVPPRETGGPVSLDRAIQNAARSIEANVKEGLKIALLNFRSPTEQFSEYVLEELTSQLVDGKKLIVVDRRELDLIRQEEEFQLSGDVNDESAQAIGKKLGAQLIVSGSLSAVGNVYRFRIRVLNVETAAIEASPATDISASEERVIFLLDGKGPIQVNTSSPQTAAAAPEITSYKTGDRGPAGGIVFYDKGTFSDGWRYLEAAPLETEFTAQWISGALFARRYWPDIKDGIGSGKGNTARIQAAEGDSAGTSYDEYAAELCAKLNFNGFNDWFLPSIEELDLVYKNLKQQNLGNFSNNWYWSSSVADKGYRVRYIRFNDGRQYYGEVTNALSVRAIRAF